MVIADLPSCARLPASCGPEGDENCCSAAVPVPGGTFQRGYDVAVGSTFSSRNFPASVRPFLLDRFEVTVGRFRAFVESGLGTQAKPPSPGDGARRLNGADRQGGWESSWNSTLPADTAALLASLKCDSSNQTWTDAPEANEELPINCVSWYEAAAFCAWDGGFLPTETEWHFAASGGNAQRAYPWSIPAGSTSIDTSYANYAGDRTRPVGRTSPRGDARWGHADLGGNVWEWNLDWHSPTYSIPCVDCSNLSEPPNRVIRGGSYYDAAPVLRSASRYPFLPEQRGANIGVRCARDHERATAR